MKLEDEIHQKKFKSIEQKLLLNIFYTNNWLRTKHDSAFKQLDLTEQQYNVLRILRGQYPKPCNLKLIKERMLDKMSDTSRIIDKLFKKELVERTQCSDDRRNVDILISEKGMELINSLDYVDENIHHLFKTLTKEEIEVLNNLLDKIRD